MNWLERTGLFRENAADICTPERPDVLLCIDLDADYTREMSKELLEASARFLDRHRHKFSVVHVWHNCMGGIVRNASETIGRVTPCTPDKDFKEVFPFTAPAEGEYVLGKNQNSAFRHTNLQASIQSARSVHIMGVYAEYCINDTAFDALQHQFNVNILAELVMESGAQRPNFAGSASVFQPLDKRLSILSCADYE